MAAEQLANLYQDTVGVAGYTAGSLVLNVSSGSGAPSTGPFTLTVLNSTGTIVLLLFRVTSVSGTAFTGAAEGPDANAPAGSLVIGTTLSVAAIANLFSSSGASLSGIYAVAGSSWGPIYPVVQPPVAASWTQAGQATTLTDIAGGGLSLVGSIANTDPNGWTVPLAGATYTLTVLFEAFLLSGGSDIGLLISDNSGKAILFHWQAGAPYTLSVSEWNGFTSGGTPSFSGVVASGAQSFHPVFWFRVKNDGTHRTFWYSSDGQVWSEYVAARQTTGTFLTETLGGIQLASNNGTLAALGTVVSVKNTSP